MAVSIPREIYTLGAVQFSTQPLAQLQGQLLARKAAKEEALNKYFYDLQGKINTAGVRQVDVAGIDQDIKNWQQSWSKDAKGLQKLEHQANYQNILRRIEQSKNRAKLEMDLGKMRVEGKYDPDEDDLQVQQRIGLSVYDPRSYKADGVSEYGLGDLSPSVPEFDATKQNQFFSAVTKGKTAGEVPDTSRAPIIEKGTGYIITPFKKEFSKEQIIAMANDAGELTKADRVSRKYYNRILGNPESDQFINLKAAYDILSPGGIMDTPEEVAKADAFIRFSQPVEVGTKRVKEEDWRERAIFQAFLRSQTSTGVNLLDYDVLGKYNPQIANIVQPGATAEERIAVPTEVVFEKDIPSEDLELITNKGSVSAIVEKGMKPYFKVRSDGNWEGARGKLIDKSSVARSNLDKTSLTEERRLRQGLIKTTTVPKVSAKKGELD